MCSKRLGPRREVGDTVVFERLFVSPTPSGGWGRVGTTERLGQNSTTSAGQLQTKQGPGEGRGAAVGSESELTWHSITEQTFDDAPLTLEYDLRAIHYIWISFGACFRCQKAFAGS